MASCGLRRFTVLVRRSTDQQQLSSCGKGRNAQPVSFLTLSSSSSLPVRCWSLVRVIYGLQTFTIINVWVRSQSSLIFNDQRINGQVPHQSELPQPVDTRYVRVWKVTNLCCVRLWDKTPARAQGRDFFHTCWIHTTSQGQHRVPMSNLIRSTTGDHFLRLTPRIAPHSLGFLVVCYEVTTLFLLQLCKSVLQWKPRNLRTVGVLFGSFLGRD